MPVAPVNLSAELQTAERLASIGAVAAGVAHELNNPLAAVSSSLTYLDEALTRHLAGDPGAPPLHQLRQAVRDALEGAARVSGIVQRLRQAAEPAPGAPTALPTPAKRRRLLVIDDEAIVARSVSRLLSPLHDVTALTSPAEALRRVEAGERWDLVLCDLSMPELSGMDVEAAVAAVAPDLVPRILYLTGGAFTERARAFLEEGRRPYLEKPFLPEVLRARVAEALQATAGGE
jgi:CheY-like chemotaxis protein